MSFELSRRQYADLYGPTTGDSIRLADTDLFLEIGGGPARCTGRRRCSAAAR